MIFENAKRVKFNKCPLKSVVCQLRFPNILTITNDMPAAFQEKIRKVFPDFQELVEEQNQIIIGRNEEQSPNPRFIQRKSKNYRFSTADNVYSINLTNTFISLSTSQYTTWDEFKSNFILPLKSFIEIYKPAYFTRIGLRYIDAFNYTAYNLTDATLREYFNPAVLGCFSDDKLSNNIRSLQHLFELNIAEGQFAKILTAKAQVTGEIEPSLVLDSDFISTIKVDSDAYENIMDSLHNEASGFIHWAITEKMANKMEPEDL